MELDEALLQINTIRAQVTRTELFRGYRAATVAGTGFLALCAALSQAAWIAEPQQQIAEYLQLWLCVAASSVAMVGIELALRYWRADSPWVRQQTVRAVTQFVPCLAAGGLLTWALANFAPQHAALLPGLWAIVFSLGMFASANQLPPAMRAVAAYYLVAGTACIAWAQDAYALSPWTMASTFGVGQFLSAAVLYWNLERSDARG
ncbi:MAG: hypothetical protein K8T91_18145 [Planctomycetes bacterium]|nr:hypothetical protein [Planctomycetota bacterium]